MKMCSNTDVWYDKDTQLNVNRFKSLCRFRKENISSTIENEMIVKHTDG